MSPLARAFLRLATLYVAVAAASFYFLRWYHPSLTGDITTAVLLALPISAGLGYLVGSRAYFQEERLLLRSITQPVFEDGKRVAAIGPVEPLGEVLKSPFAGKDCVAYRYQIERDDTDAEGDPCRRRDYWGMAVSPFQVRTPAGPVRILGYARLEAFPDALENGEAAYRAADAYVRKTPFRHPASAGERLGSLAEPLSTEAGGFRDDICTDTSHGGSFSFRESPDLRGRYLTEYRLDVGQTLMAVGYYSAAKKALVPTTSGAKQLRMSTYTPALWASENRDWAHTYIRWGTGFTILGLGCALATRWC